MFMMCLHTKSRVFVFLGLLVITFRPKSEVISSHGSHVIALQSRRRNLCKTYIIYQSLLLDTILERSLRGANSLSHLRSWYAVA
jgi:hypothetical protein